MELDHHVPKLNATVFGNDIQVKPKKNYIALHRHSNFVYINIRKSRLDLTLIVKKEKLADSRKIAMDVSTTNHYGTGAYLI
jgi:predicted transport protein